VEARRDDRKIPARTIGLRCLARAVRLHDATTSSSMWPSLERLVSI
jgi:hypothetical protein